MAVARVTATFCRRSVNDVVIEYGARHGPDQHEARRPRGHIRRRGGSLQVLVYAGVDPLTGEDHYLTESTRDEREAQKILTRLLGQVDEQRNPRTRATLGAALESWLRTHEAEETTLDGYSGYVRRTVEPALGAVPLAKITP